MKIQYVEDLDNVVSMAILTATVLKSGLSAAPAVLAMLAARFAAQQALPIVQPADVPAETWAAWVSATGHAFGRKALKEILTYIGTNVVAPTIARTVMGTCEMYKSKQTKQMCIIVVINETDYEISRTDGWDMLRYPEPAATFSKLPPRRIGDSDLVSWGVWATGSGSTSGAASAIKLQTTNCPPGGKNFQFIVSASCPAWTPTNTMALTMWGSDCEKECRDNESVRSNVTATRRETVGEAHVAVSAELENTGGKRAFVVVRITSTALVSQPKL
jgi:hypothetical protein